MAKASVAYIAPGPVDRSHCTAKWHGNEAAYRRFNCRCIDAIRDRQLKARRRFKGTHIPALVPIIGTRRRIRSLGAIGWSNPALSEETGVGRGAITTLRQSKRQTQVLRATHDEWVEIYARLQGTPGPSPGARVEACKRGYAPPLLWEGIDMDDPDAQPWEDVVLPRRVGNRVDREELRHLILGGCTEDEICRKLDISDGTLKDMRREIGMPRRAAG